ncbi:MAG TPA: Crp/Fnr family transcriptional regulator [bacterium]|nr:Crp/Fnr family transcriptional regulator [bacterium]HPN31482.1 Crp/Fnr family transcriptional regulator [bacterium]
MRKYLYIKNSDLFNKLDYGSITKLNEIAVIKKYAKDESVCCEGGKVEGIMIAGSGSFKVYKISENGQIYILKIAGSGESIAEVAVLLEDAAYPANVQALEESELAFIQKDDFLKLLREDNKICLHILSKYASIIFDFTQKIGDLALTSVKERLMKYFLSKCNENQSDEFELNVSKLNLAALIGTIPETISRVLKTLEKENIIEIKLKEKKIKLLKL